MSGLDPSLGERADGYRSHREAPQPTYDVPALVLAACDDADRLFEEAARLLHRAAYPTDRLYTTRLGGRIAVDAGPCWDLGRLVLDSDGIGRYRISEPQGSSSGDYWHNPREQLRVPAGVGLQMLGEELEVAEPRALGSNPTSDVLYATLDGRAEIFYDTYDWAWMPLADWLNRELASLLGRRPAPYER